MRFSEINPFIRFAFPVNSDSCRFYVAARDCRIFYVLSGKLSIVVGQTTLLLEKDSVFYCSAGTYYTILRQTSARLLVLNFDLTQNRRDIRNSLSPVPAEEFSPDLITENPSVEQFPYFSAYNVVRNAYPVLGKIQTIVDEFSRHEFLYREKCSACLKEILVLLHRLMLSGSSDFPHAVTDTIEYIRQHYGENLTNKELAQRVGYHENHLNRLFIRYTNTSLHRYLLRYRVDKGRDFLLNTDLPISLIAAKTGFSSDAHFTSCFRKVFSATPAEYRKKLKNRI